MPSEATDQSHLSSLYVPCVPSSFSDEIRFPARKQVGFCKSELLPDNLGSDRKPLISGMSFASSPLDKVCSASINSAQNLEPCHTHIFRGEKAKFCHMMGPDATPGLSKASWKVTDHGLGTQSNIFLQPAFLNAKENKLDLNFPHESSLFSSSMPERFNKSYGPFLNSSNDAINSNFEDNEPFESLKEIEAHTIGNLLPDDDDLFSGVIDEVATIISPSNSADSVEDDLFCSGGGMELEPSSQQGVVSLFDKEHPHGEYQSRSLSMGNYKSNLEDANLRDIFEDNFSERDINQGMLVVFNVDSSVSNEYLHQIFGAYGQIKEIREAPHKCQCKFIEFYDFRAASSSLHALNGSYIAGRQIQVAPIHPGVAGGLMQQLSHELRQQSGGPQRKGSPNSSMPLGYGIIPLGTITSGSHDNGIIQDQHSLFQEPISPLMENSYNGISAGVPHSPSYQLNVASIRNHCNQRGVDDLSHSLGQLKFDFQCMPGFHPHSLPEYHDGVVNSILYNSPNTTSVGLNFPGHGDRANNRCILGASSDGLSCQSFIHNEQAFGASGDTIYPLHGQQYHWSNSSPHNHRPPRPSMWPNSPSCVNNIPTLPSQLHGLPRVPSSVLSSVAPLHHHHVGSAPSVNPSIWERRHAYKGDMMEIAAFHAGSLGNMGFLASSMLHPLDFASQNIFSQVGGNFIEPSFSSPHGRLPSPQQKYHMLNGGRNSMISMPATFDSPVDRFRSRRSETSSNQADNKKQYELDIERIIHGEDVRTTLMIKNIPNKYTSKMLLAAIDEHHRGTYDFIYLPIDFKNKCNVGYAFINLIDSQQIIPFYKAFNGKKWEKFNSEKVASLAYARIQGKAALIAHFQNSSLMNEDKRCRPILFHSEGPNAGDQEPFPIGINIRSRSGRSKTQNNEDNPQGSPSNSANDDEFTNDSNSEEL